MPQWWLHIYTVIGRFIDTLVCLLHGFKNQLTPHDATIIYCANVITQKIYTYHSIFCMYVIHSPTWSVHVQFDRIYLEHFNIIKL